MVCYAASPGIIAMGSCAGGSSPSFTRSCAISSHRASRRSSACRICSGIAIRFMRGSSCAGASRDKLAILYGVRPRHVAWSRKVG